MSEPFLGMIIITPYNFAPRGWAFCQGQQLSIAQNTALFSLLGTTFGGNGQTTFALPDLRGRVPNGAGTGPGLQNYVLGEVSGTENTTLAVTQMPAHIHTPITLAAHGEEGNSNNPSGKILAAAAGTNPAALIYSNAAADVNLTPGGSTGIAGGSQPFSILQPFLTLNFCIAMEGIFPSRN